VIGARARQEMIGYLARDRLNLPADRIVQGRGATSHIAHHIAAGAEGSEQCVVQAAHRRL